MSDVFTKNVMTLKESAEDSFQFLSSYKFICQLVQKNENTYKTSLLSLNAVVNGDILSEFKNYEQLRRNEKVLLTSRRREIMRGINYLHHLQNSSKAETQRKYISNVIKAVREAVKADILNFREQEEIILYKLAEEQNCLSKELEDISFKLTKISGKVNKKYSSKAVDFNLPFEVIEFQDFVGRNNGHLGGWNERDHHLFLKLRAKYKEKPIFFSEILKSLPLLSEAKIRNHELWYVEYSKKKERKDTAILQWKHEQLQKKKKIKEVRNSIPKDKKYLNSQNEQKSLRVKAWKQSRIVLKENEYAERERLKNAQEESNRLQFMDHQKRLKEKLKKYKEQNADQLSQELPSFIVSENHCTQNVSKKIIEILQMRDDIIFMKKKENKMVKELKKMEKELKLKNQINVNVPYDPYNFLKPTSAWIQRKQKVGTKDVEQLTFLPRRAIPEWRKDMHL